MKQEEYKQLKKIIKNQLLERASEMVLEEYNANIYALDKAVCDEELGGLKVGDVVIEHGTLKTGTIKEIIYAKDKMNRPVPLLICERCNKNMTPCRKPEYFTLRSWMIKK